MNHPVKLVPALGALLACIQPARADITLIGRASFQGTALDKCARAEALGPDKVPQNRLGSFGSAIDYTGKDNLYVAADDRGPNNGEVNFLSRVQTIRIVIDPGATEPVKAELVATTMLTDEHGTALTGFSGAFDAKDQRLGARFDAEGVRLSATGTVFLSDEYGPWIDEFSMAGKRVRRLPVPARFLIEHPDADAKKELALNTRGRQTNRGFEGLAISPDKKTLWAILQSPLIQDGGVSPDHKRIGVNLRILEMSPAAGAGRELVYVMETRKHGVNEMLAISDHEMLVLERDGEAAKERALYRIDTAGATDVSKIDALPSGTLPETIVPVRKRLWMDFTDSKFGLAGAGMPEKIEGLTFGPDLPDGRRTLVVTTDNDLKADEPSWFWVFAVDPRDLAPAPPSPLGAATEGH